MTHPSGPGREGANEVLRLFIALNGIQGPAARLKEVSAALRRPLSNFGVVSGYMTSRVSSLLGATPHIEYDLHPSLAEHKRYFESHVAQLAVEADRAITKYRRAITDRQLVLERLANMAIELYATAAVIARTQRLIEVQGFDGSERERALCDLFCVMAGRRFRIQRQALAGGRHCIGAVEIVGHEPDRQSEECGDDADIGEGRESLTTEGSGVRFYIHRHCGVGKTGSM